MKNNKDISKLRSNGVNGDGEGLILSALSMVYYEIMMVNDINPLRYRHGATDLNSRSILHYASSLDQICLQITF